MSARSLALVVVLAFAAIAALFGRSHREWPSSIARQAAPASTVDKSNVAIGPHRFNVSGLVGGPGGEDGLTLYVVVGPDDVHLQRIGEPPPPKGWAVIPLNVSYLPTAPVGEVHFFNEGLSISGLRMLPRPKADYVLYVPDLRDAVGHPTIYCNSSPNEIKEIEDNKTLDGARGSHCNAYFRPRHDLRAFMNVFPWMLPTMQTTLPKIYKFTNELIKGE